jgi:glucan phosphoethanolaminetransferase (alkaline phosphatase superfamily)
MKLVASVLLLLALLALLAIHRNGLTADEAAQKGIGVAVRVTNDAFHNEYRTVAVLALVVLFAFVIWTVVRANKEGSKAIPPAKESSSSNKIARI